MASLRHWEREQSQTVGKCVFFCSPFHFTLLISPSALSIDISVNCCWWMSELLCLLFSSTKKNSFSWCSLCIMSVSWTPLQKTPPLRHLSDTKTNNFKNYVQVILWGLRAHVQNQLLLFMFLYSGRESEKLTYITKYLKAVAMFRDYNNTSEDPDFTQVSLYISRCFNICCCCIHLN